MINVISYTISHYAYFAIFLFAFFGIGRFAVYDIFRLEPIDPILSIILSIVVGQGIFIVFLQCLGIGGLLVNTWLIPSLAFAAMMAVYQSRSVLPPLWNNIKAGWKDLSSAERFGLALVIVFAFPTLLEPLRPPWPGDELQYHLPHAQQWAQSGKLTINEWLRYPYFPFNYNLLYASAYVIYGDVFTHLFNALAGWLIAIIIYRLGKLNLTHAVACIATSIWFQIQRREFGKTQVDMGVTLYALTASLAFIWWMEYPKDRRWLAVSAFLMGVAVGSKYQALFFLPIFGIAVLLTDRKASTLLIATVSVLIPCIYWYVRNAFLTGDPFDPIGGKVFGFTDWNLADYTYQFDDLKRSAAWPSVLLWPAIFALPNLRRPGISFDFLITALCLYFSVIWLITSHYPRYLMPIYPWLILLASDKWIYIFRYVRAGMLKKLTAIQTKTLLSLFWVILSISVTAIAINFTKTFWSYISPTSHDRDLLMRKEIKGYTVLEYALQHSDKIGKIFNISLADAVYYAPKPIWGDVFGPWRHRDIISENPITFAHELRKRGLNAVIAADPLSKKLESNPYFYENFSIEFESQGIKLYLVKNDHEKK